MRLNLRKVMTGEIEKLPFSGELDLSAVDINGETPFALPVTFEGYTENRAGVLFLECDIRARLDLACARCTKPIQVEKTTHISHLLAESLENEDEEGEILTLSDGEIELDEPITTALLLSLDMRYLCDEGCKGLCSKCGKNLNEGDCDCPKKEIDPRLQALADLLN